MTSSATSLRQSNKRMFFLALDSMNLAFVRSNFDILPTFKRLINDGSFRPLEIDSKCGECECLANFLRRRSPRWAWPLFPVSMGPDDNVVQADRQALLGKAVRIRPILVWPGRQGF